MDPERPKGANDAQEGKSTQNRDSAPIQYPACPVSPRSNPYQVSASWALRTSPVIQKSVNSSVSVLSRMFFMMLSP